MISKKDQNVGCFAAFYYVLHSKLRTKNTLESNRNVFKKQALIFEAGGLRSLYGEGHGHLVEI